MEETIIIILIISLFVALAGVLVWFGKKQEKLRSQDIRSMAKRLGFTHEERVDRALVDTRDYNLFNKGGSKKVKNYLSKESRHGITQYYDYSYVVSTGQSTQIHHHSIVNFRMDGMNVPRFRLLPENLFDKIGEAFGRQDIDFDDNPEFSDMFALRGPDEDKIRRVFSYPVTRALQNHKGLCIEAGGDEMMIYRRKRLKSDEIEGFLKDASEILALFYRA